MEEVATTGAQSVVLLLEDNGLVGLDLRDALEEAGYRVAGPFGKGADALFWLGQETPDLAIIDLQLADGPAQTLTTALRERGVPFLIYSGRRADDRLADGLHDVPWLEKPSPSTAVVEVLRTIRAPS